MRNPVQTGTKSDKDVFNLAKNHPKRVTLNSAGAKKGEKGQITEKRNSFTHKVLPLPIKHQGMSSQGLLDGAASELFNTYETDYQVARNEAEQKLSQISDLDGGMCSYFKSPI